MRKCSFLTTDNLQGYTSDDELVYSAFRERGWSITSVSWHCQDVDWNEFDSVIIRTTWDYHKNPRKFLSVLQTIANSSACLINPLPLVRWNLDKIYLRDLQQKGVTIVPTVWGKSLQIVDMAELFEQFATRQIVVKPTISASSTDTYKVTVEDMRRDTIKKLQTSFVGRSYMVQPFVKSIVAEGEYSLFFFNKEFSHAVVKRPKANDFRSQEEYGATIELVNVERSLINSTGSVLDLLDWSPLYARVDLLRLPTGELGLMELELIEPALYFRMQPRSVDHFVEAFVTWMNGRRPLT